MSTNTKQLKSKGFILHEELCKFVNDEKENNVSICDTMFIVHNGNQYVLFYF